MTNDPLRDRLRAVADEIAGRHAGRAPAFERLWRASRTAPLRRAGLVAARLALVGAVVAAGVALRPHERPNRIDVAGPTASAPAVTSAPTVPSPKPTRSVAVTPTGKTATSPSPSPTRQETCDHHSRTVKPPEGATVSISLDRTAYSAGQTAKLTITMKYSGSKAYSHYRGVQQYDLWVTDDQGTVWVWSHGKVFPQVYSSETLKPGETKSYTESWTTSFCGGKALPAGHYVAHGEWVDQRGAWPANQVAFDIR